MKRTRTLAVGFALVAACAGQQQTDEDVADSCVQNLPSEIYESYLRRPVDTNGDCEPDFWKLYEVLDEEGEVLTDLSVLADPDRFALLRDRQNQRIREKWLDLNFDGTIDVVRRYDVHERLVEQSVDIDFDGDIDRVDTFDEGAILTRQSDEDGDGVSESTRYYREGTLHRMEIDTDGTGTPDTWRFYDDGALVRIGRDLNGDEDIDEWIRRPNSGASSTTSALASPRMAGESEGSGETAEE